MLQFFPQEEFEIFNYLKEEFLEKSRESLNITPKSKNLAIFDKLEKVYDDFEEEDLFKVKLDFISNNKYNKVCKNLNNRCNEIY